MSRPIVEVHLVPGTSILVSTPDGVDFMITNMDPKFQVPGDVLALKVFKEEDGKVDLIYETPYEESEPAPEVNKIDLPMESVERDIYELGVKAAAEPPSSPEPRTHTLNPPAFAAPYGNTATLDQMLAGAVNPGNVVASILASGEEAQQAALYAPPPPPLPVDGQPAGASEPIAAPAATAPGLKPMDSAPRDGTTIMLGLEGLDPIPGSWSSSFGRQFWQDSEGEAQGMDEAFSGWRQPTDSEREEYGL